MSELRRVGLLGTLHHRPTHLQQQLALQSAMADDEARAAKRARLGADPAWQAYIGKTRPLIITQENKLLIPASFLTVKWQD
jgi:hypothetical protein